MDKAASAADHSASIERAIGRIEAGLIGVQDSLAQFRLDVQGTLQNHRAEFLAMLQEQRERHHLHNNQMQKHLGEVDVQLMQINARLSQIENKQAEERGAWTANKSWLTWLATMVSAVVSALVSGLVYWLTNRWH